MHRRSACASPCGRQQLRPQPGNYYARDRRGRRRPRRHRTPVPACIAVSATCRLHRNHGRRGERRTRVLHAKPTPVPAEPGERDRAARRAIRHVLWTGSIAIVWLPARRPPSFASITASCSSCTGRMSRAAMACAGSTSSSTSRQCCSRTSRGASSASGWPPSGARPAPIEPDCRTSVRTGSVSA